MLLVRIAALVAIAAVVAGVWLEFSPGWAAIACGALLYLDIYMPTPSGGKG